MHNKDENPKNPMESWGSLFAIPSSRLLTVNPKVSVTTDVLSKTIRDLPATNTVVYSYARTIFITTISIAPPTLGCVWMITCSIDLIGMREGNSRLILLARN